MRNLTLLIGFTATGMLLLILVMFLARFLRWGHIKTVLEGPLPEFNEIAGKLDIFGQSLEASATVDSAMRRQIGALKDRIDSLESSNRIQETAMRELTKVLLEAGEADD